MNAKPVIAARPRRRTVTELALDCGRFVGERFDESPLVALSGSFRVPAAGCRSALLQQLTARLLTCGTLRRDRSAIADVLERRGVSLSIEADTGRIAFSALGCAEDFATIADLLAECLSEPRFDAEDVAIERALLASELRYRALDPRERASIALSQRLFPPGHPRHEPAIEQQVDEVEALTAGDVRACHDAHFGASELLLVALGGIDPMACATALERRLRSWRSHREPAMPRAAATPSRAGGTTRIEAPGSERFVVLLGVGLPFDAADGAAPWLANRILGAGYASRLVETLREQQALAYAVRSELVEPEPGLEGRWCIAVSLGPDKLERGLATTRAQIARFAEYGVSARELDLRRDAAIGALSIENATLQGAGAFLLRALERGGEAIDVDAFVAALEAVSTQQIHRVASRLAPAALETVIVGPCAGD